MFKRVLTLWLILIPLAGACGCTALRTLSVPAAMRGMAPADEALHGVHDALFATFVPLDSLPLDDATRALALAARDRLWVARAPAPEFRSALAAMTRLDVLAGESARLREFIAGAHERRFDRLTAAERATVVRLLRDSDSNALRLLAARLRMLYLLGAYASPFGAAVAGIPPRPVLHPRIAEFVKANTPRFPETWLRYERAAHTLAPASGEIDELIVGSGPAGSVLAHELARAGHRVVLVDQGALVIPGAMDTRLPPQLTESGGGRFSEDGSVSFRSAEAVGGGTTINIDLAFPPTHPSVQHQIELWRREGRILPDQFTRDQLERAYAWVRASVGTRTPAEAEINPNNRALWDGARRRGLHPKLYDLNSYTPGASPSPVTDKRTAVSQLLLEAMRDARNPLVLLPEVHASRVLFERRGGALVATGVALTARPTWDAPGVIHDPLKLGIRPGDSLVVHARRVVLCAGTMGSAALLLASGVANPNIGRGIVGHIALPVIGEFEQRIDALEGTFASVYVDDFAISDRYFLEAMAAGPEYAAIMTPGDGRQVFDVVHVYRHLAGFGVMVLDTPSPSNRIVLGADGRPVIQYRLSREDKRRMRIAVAEGIRVMFAAGAKRVLIPSSEPLLDPGAGPGGGLFLSTPAQAVEVGNRLAFVPNRTTLTSAHLQSSNKMGTRATNSVVAPDHHVWGTENLYVMDSSIFPSSIGANPMQSIYTFAKILADQWVAEARAK
jgi:choline dehydrogenase-like flavoprotein